MRSAVALLLIAVCASGCAHGVSRRTRVARVLVGTGAAVTVVGGLVTAGCVDDAGNAESGCSGGPGDGDLAAGIPIMVLGAGLLVVGLLARPKDAGRLLPPPSSLNRPVPLNRPLY